MKQKQVGIFGGTFNPIHNGHLYLLRQCRQELDLDQILLVPTFYPPHKEAPDLAPAEDRFRMCQLAVNGCPEFLVSDYEITRRKVSYSYETVRYFHQKYADWKFTFLMGSDVYFSIEQWKNVQEIFPLVRFGVMARNHGEATLLMDFAESLKRRFGIVTNVVAVKPLPLSSTEIRQKIAVGKPVEGLLPPPVARYIYEHKLYRKTEAEHGLNVLP